MITNEAELMSVQARVQVIQAMLTHARRTLTAESYKAQSKGWLMEWERLEAEIRDYFQLEPGPVEVEAVVA